MSVAAQQLPPPGGLTLDHVSHFVPRLGAAAHALEALGFAVTPESAQQTQEGPAGTSNVCVMLEHGYLEFLAPTADTPNAQRLRATMQRYAGVHLCCFGTPDAYDRMGYYERWVTSITQTMIQHGVITTDELGRKMAEIEKRG